MSDSDSDRKARKKLKKYIQQGNIKKVEKLIKQDTVDINAIIDRKKGWGALHLACNHGDWKTVTFLIKEGSDTSRLDCNLSLPIHLLLHKACIWAKYDFSISNFNDMLESVLLVLHSNHKIDKNGFTVTDNQGFAVIDLIEYLVETLSDIDVIEKCDCPLFKELAKFLTNISVKADEERWSEKLHNYCFDDMQEPFEGFADFSASESFSTFADRIAKEKREKKRKHEAEIHVNRKKANKSQESSKPKLILRPEPPKLDILKVQKETYEEKYQLFLVKEHIRICFDDIPWPGGSHATAAEQAKICLYSTNPDVCKTITREQQRRWHPDKFIQHYGEYLCADDKEKILDHVKQLSQSINDFNV